MRRGAAWIACALLVALLPADSLAQAGERLELDRCIGGKCRKNGRYLWVSTTADELIVYIDPHRCREFDYHCPTSYGRFAAEGGAEAIVEDYQPGSKTVDVFKVRIPRDRPVLYVYEINGSSRRDTLDLRPYLEDAGEAPAPPAAAAPPTPEPEPAPPPRAPAAAPAAAAAAAPPAPRAVQSIDDLYRSFAQAYDRLDTNLVAGLYTEDALYLGPSGEILRGRAAIAGLFDRMFRDAERSGASLSIRFESVDRSIEGPLAYDVGYYTLERSRGAERTVDRGKFTVVCKRVRGDGWRFHVDSTSPASDEH